MCCEGTWQNENENDKKVHKEIFLLNDTIGKVSKTEWASMRQMLTRALNLWEIALERPDSTVSCGKR